MAVADVTGDGKPDLIATNFGCNEGCVAILAGNGDGTFQAATVYDSGAEGAVSVAIADTNGDSKPDLIVANLYGNNNGQSGFIGVLLNTTSGPTLTTLGSSLNPANFGQVITFTASVASQAFKGTPTGTINFLDGSTSLGTSNLNGSGVATLSTSTLAVGTHNITAAYSGDSNFAPSTSPVLNQVVQGAIAVLSPASLNFGNQTVDIKSAPQNAMLTNTGNIALTISTLGISGTNSGDFAETNNCGSSVAAGGHCSIAITFDPAATGAQSAAVSITDNAPGSPQTIPLSGTGVVPAVTLSPTSLTFANQVVFTTSAPQKITLTNTGLGILKISGGGLTGQFAETNNCSGTLAPGASCNANVTFKPTKKGVLTGSLSLTDNAPGSPQKVSLSGTGTYLQITPASVNFGNQPVHTTSLAKTITISNQGSGSVNFSGISISGADAGDFAETNNCGNSVASGASCFMKVKFTPSQQGVRTADVMINDDGGGSPQTVPLTGTGTP